MAVGDDDMMEGFVSARILEDLESNPSVDAISAEDVTWADSCLIGYPDDSENNWNCLKEALLEILDGQPEPLAHTTDISGVIAGGNDMEIQHSTYKAETARFPDISYRNPPTLKGAEITSDSSSTNKEDVPEVLEDCHTNISFINAFLPTFKGDHHRVRETSDSDSDHSSSADMMEPSSDDIFRVWDIDIPAEEDDFVKSLNKALAEISSQPITPTSDDFVPMKDESIDSIDHLIASIKDLYLD